MKTLKLAAAAVVCVLFFSHAAAAAPLTLTLQRTSVLYNEDPPGAPLPLGRTQYDAGDIKLNGQKIGEYLSVKDVHDNTLNVASLTITLFLTGRSDVPTVIKLEGARQPLEEKIALAHGLLGNVMQRVDEDPFPAIGCGEKFADIPGDVWRVMVAPSDAPRVARQLQAQHWLGDWAGGVIWLAAAPTEAARIRKVAAEAKGQAMLLRASPESRALHGLYAAQPAALAALGRAVKAAFDPLSLFNPGRL